jgi:DNA-binding transcriptional MerR regulator
MTQEQAIYNIGVVERMTGIPSATLRIWERRYDFPKSIRTKGRHRLYTRSEIERLRWVKVKIDSGMQTRQAIRALETLDEQPGIELMSDSPQTPATDSLLGPSPDTNSYLHILQKRIQEALINHNVEDADAIWDETLAHYTTEDIILHLIGPTLRHIGMGWEKGEIAVGTEHLASHYLRQKLMMWMNIGPPAFNVPPSVLACAPGEYHEGGLLMFGTLLRRRRWPVAYLGQSIPLKEVAAFVNQVSPAAIVMVAMTEEPAAALVNWPEALPEVAAAQQLIFGFGGRIFNQESEWRSRVPGIFLGTTVDEGVRKLESMLQQNYVPLG